VATTRMSNLELAIMERKPCAMCGEQFQRGQGIVDSIDGRVFHYPECPPAPAPSPSPSPSPAKSICPGERYNVDEGWN
jgi:hypothetical protein